MSVSFNDGSTAKATIARHRPADRHRGDQGRGRLGLTPATIGSPTTSRSARASSRSARRSASSPRSPAASSARSTAPSTSAPTPRATHDVPRHPDRRRDQPRQQRRRAGRPGRQRRRHQLLDPHRQLRGRGRLDRPRLRDPDRRGAPDRRPDGERRDPDPRPARHLGHRRQPAGRARRAPQGAEVQEVSDGSTAADAGLAKGDVITKVDDQLITGADSLVATIRSYRPGDNVTVTWLRNGEEQSAELVLDSD